MRLNIFRIHADAVGPLKVRLAEAKTSVIHAVDQGAWHGEFYFSDEAAPTPVPWALPFAAYFHGGKPPNNLAHFAAFVFTRGEDCFAISYGKSHFYLRAHCDVDFGIELAKRIADEGNIRQTAGKRFAGKRTKDIKSYAPDAPLLIESGESVEYLQASIVPEHQERWGKSGKFGSSVQVSPDIGIDEIGAFFDDVLEAMALEAQFPLPRTLVVTDPDEVERLDGLLLDELQSSNAVSDFTTNSIDLYGVDFVFRSGEGSFTVKCGRKAKQHLDQLTMGDLKQYIADKQIARGDILKIKITHQPDDGAEYVKSIKEDVDFIADGENVVLSDGKWLYFNQDYLDYLNDAIAAVEVEEVEPEFGVIHQKEGDFNASEAVAAAGFELADKNFDILRTKSNAKVEAWDLRRGNTVYAVKVGVAQKLHYVCDQAVTVLDLLKGRAETKEVPHFDRYCLWFGYRVKNVPANLAESDSIMLKIKVENWARKAREFGVTPVIRISQSVAPIKDEKAG